MSLRKFEVLIRWEVVGTIFAVDYQTADVEAISWGRERGFPDSEVSIREVR